MVKKTRSKRGAYVRVPDDQKREIVSIIDAMASLDASWEVIELELHRRANSPKSIIDKIPNRQTLEKWAIAEGDCKTFTEYKQKRKEVIKVKLKQKAIKMALEKENATMLIFCLKNLCGWTDNKQDDNQDRSRTITLKYAKEALKEQQK